MNSSNRKRSYHLSKAKLDSLVKNTRIYRQWEYRKKEIDLHKWYESEKAGHDIGLNRATVDWLIHHGRDQDSSPPHS